MQSQTAATLAERLSECCDRWTRRHLDTREFLLTDAQVNWEIYDHLSLITFQPELIKQIFQRLESTAQLRPLRLFLRLKLFYGQWCEGVFMDSISETLPQKKLRLLRQFQPESSPSLREIDISTGLNILILLLAIHRYIQAHPDLAGKVMLYPCGEPGVETVDSDRLLKIIGYSRWLGVTTFLERVGGFMRGANLQNVNLSGSNLLGVDFSQADLRGANLCGTNLVGAVFAQADLRHTNFKHANLVGADFSGAKASSADFSRVNLMSAELSGAQLNNVNCSSSILSGANFSHADLTSANLSNAHLRGTYLNNANLSRANLRDAVLAQADLSNARLIFTDLRHADLSGANLAMIEWDQTTKWDNARGVKL